MELNNGKERPSWDDYFMMVALSIASRASCRKLNSGVVIVKDKRIIATGYNGSGPGIESCFNLGFCRKEKGGVKWEEKNSGACFAAHAEINALLQSSASKNKGAFLFTIYSPCADCAKAIVAAGIKEVIYLKPYSEPNPRTVEMFREAGIVYRKLDLEFDKCVSLMKNLFSTTFG